MKDVMERNQQKFSHELNQLELDTRMKIREYEQNIQENDGESRALREKCFNLEKESERLASELSRIKEKMYQIENRSYIEDASQLLD